MLWTLTRKLLLKSPINCRCVISLLCMEIEIAALVDTETIDFP